MKFIICVCLLVVVIGPCAKAKSFDFANFFLGTGKKDLSSDSILPRSASQGNLFESSSLDYNTEESDTFNSSSDDVYDVDYQNSSSDSLEISSRNESEDVASIPDREKATVEAENNKTPVETVAEVQNNETHSSDKTETTTVSVSSAATSERSTSLAEESSTANVSKESTTAVGTGTEPEEVVLGTTTDGATTVPVPRTIFQKSIDWVEDAYTLSILIPITAGILFATTIILVIALCRCVRRCCRRRSFKRKPLPDSVKSLSASDRARLLGDTSDEEF